MSFFPLSIAAEELSYSGMPFGLDPWFISCLCLGMGCALILIALALKARLRRQQRSLRRPEAPIDRDRLVVLLGQGEKIIESGISGVFISLDRFFRDIGFSLIIAPTPRRFDSVLQEGVPVIIGIDCRIGNKALRKLDAICHACFALRSSVVFFYNAERPEGLKPPASLPQANFLGESFTSLQVLELISNAISVGMNAPRPAETGREACTLEGKNVGNALQEIFQLLEVGRRTGMLSLEDGLPSGIVNFEQGVITFAQTRIREGIPAVMEILAITGGTFHFFENKRVMQSNCRFTAQEALMQWACRVDEDGKTVPRPLL